MSRPKEIGYLYVNGLNDGQTKPHDRLAMWWWQRKGAELRHAHVDWFDGQGIDSKIGYVGDQVKEMLGQFGGVALVGSSAGGSLALNTFHELQDANICAVMAHARLKVGRQPIDARASLYRRAYMDTARPSRAFMDSVSQAENVTIPGLTQEERQRLLTLSSIADGTVPTKLMTTRSIANHRSLTFGHAGGFIAHFIADRDMIMNFAESSLSS